ncbi:anaerobic ribonucleoside-triphosphate reductase activating protein [Lachnospiraceae bacterium C1.1]|nr:anaerobic ribonucleoside-triphosphate reductase activating protein [Lachnospiraceae bacterium C1.1]
MKCRIAGYIKHSLVNGPGIRLVLFFQGCPHHCKGCQNPDTWDPEGGELTDTEELIDLIRSVKHIQGITFSGGDPLMQSDALTELASFSKNIGLDVWCYTGWTIEEIRSGKAGINQEALKYIDVLVDGPFIEKLKDEDLELRGSSNQRIIRLDQTFL